jgi:hypothetical protein
MRKFKFSKKISFILMTIAAWILMSAFSINLSAALETSEQKILVAGIEAPHARKAAFEKKYPKSGDIPLISKRPEMRTAALSGDDGHINRDFIIPVMHKEAAPEGYIEIRSQNDLDGIRDNLNGNFILMNDIIMEGTWIPVGDYHNPFTGIFDGNGYVIKNMCSEITNSMAGLFGRTLEAEIMNLGIENSSIEDNGYDMISCGGIVAEAQISVIDNCYNKGHIGRYYDPDSGTDFAYTMDTGGIAGSIAGSTVKNCYNTGDVFNSDWAAGIAGYVYSGSIENCYNEGYVYGVGYSGGIAAKLTGSIKNCYNSGEIYAGFVTAGGIAGYNATIKDVIENCYNSGVVAVTESDSPDSGGIIGSIFDGSILNSYNSNSNTGNGIFAIANYYPDGEDNYYSNVIISNCYYPESLYYDIENIELFQYLNVKNLTALSDEAMKLKESFEEFNFEDVWDINADSGTPFLKVFSEYIYLAGDVTDFLTLEPIAEASVILRIWGENSDNPLEFRVSTDEKGEYAAWVLPGTINIRVNKSGYINFDNGNGNEFTEDEDSYHISLRREKEEDLSSVLVLTGNTVYEEEDDDGGETKKRSVGGVLIEVESYDTAGNAYIYTTFSTTPADTGKNSRFQVYFYPGKVRITAYKKGYGNVHIQTWLDEEKDDYEILLTPLLKQVYIEMNIKSVQPHYELTGEEEVIETDVSNFGNFEFKLIDKTQSDLELLPDKDFTVSGKNLVITRNSATLVDKEGNVIEIGNDIEGHLLEINVTDISGKMGTASTSFTFTADKENPVPALPLTFTEQGRWETSGIHDESFDVSMALLFGKNGGFIDRFMPIDGRFEGKQLPEGEYTLVFIANYPSLQQVPDLNYFEDKGFINGTDYISISIEIRQGIISVADMTGTIVPAFDLSKEYLNLNGTSLTLNRYKTLKQYSVTSAVRFSIDKRHIYTGTDIEISIMLTENCSVYQNKIWLDGKVYEYSKEGLNIIITVPAETHEETVNGTVQFYVIANDYGENTVNANLSFTRTDGEKITCPIGTVNLLSYEVEITNLPARSTNNQYTVTGNAASGTWISVYVDGVEIMPAVKANSAGNWKKTLVLYGEESGEAVFNIKATASTGISTKELELICDVSVPSVSTIKLGTRNHNNDFYGGVSLKYDGGEWIHAEYPDKSVTQPFSYIRYVNPWFYGDMREKVSFEVSFDELPGNSKVRIAAYDGSGRIIAYVPLNYSTQKKLWEGSRDFSDNQLPKMMSVLYTAGNTPAESTGIESEKITLSPLLDPSGFVYEAVQSNRLENAEIVLWKKNEDGKEEKWIAEDYSQMNPFYTGADGNYMWDVPDGEYQVRVSKEDYEPAQSEWIKVPPPQTEVNIGLRSKATPSVIGADRVKDDHGQEYIAVNFSQYMNVATLNKSAGTVSVSVNDINIEDFDITFINGDNAAADDEISSDRFYAKTMELWLPASLEDGDIIKITISGSVTNYRDYKLSELGEDWTETIEIGDVEDEIIKISPDVGEKVVLVVVDDVSYIAGIDAGLNGITTSALTEALIVKVGYTIEIVDKDGAEVTGNIGTGMILQVKDETGSTIDTFTLVVKYDVTGTGKAGLADIFSVLNYSVGNAEFDAAQKLAIESDKTGLSLIFDMIDYAVGNQ